MSVIYKDNSNLYKEEFLRLEAVTTCVGFDDFLDVSLGANHDLLDHMIVVTTHDDTATKKCARKHGVTLVETDLFKKNGRNFNKGAAINAGFNYFQYHGWRLHLDCDIVLPSNFRRMIFNHTHLDTNCIYGADRCNVIGREEYNKITKQYTDGMIVGPRDGHNTGFRFIHTLDGYSPLGFFQFYHASCQKPYPYSLGTAAHDDLMFANTWPHANRRLLPSVFVYHLCSTTPQVGENWDGHRKQPRF